MMIPPLENKINLFFFARMGEYGQSIPPIRRSTTFNFIHLWRIFIRKLLIMERRHEKSVWNLLWSRFDHHHEEIQRIYRIASYCKGQLQRRRRCSLVLSKTMFRIEAPMIRRNVRRNELRRHFGNEVFKVVEPKNVLRWKPEILVPCKVAPPESLISQSAGKNVAPTGR